MWPIFIRLLGQALWRHLIYAKILSQKKAIIKIYNPGNFLEENICSSYFIDSQKLAIGQKISFWACFHGRLPQVRLNLYKIFTSDAVQDNTSHMLWYLM